MSQSSHSPSVPFVKPPLDFDSQYRKLLSYVIEDSEFTLSELLQSSSYYRIKRYVYPLQSIYSGSKIPVKRLFDIINFDDRLRFNIFECIKPIEVYFRSCINEYMTLCTNDPFWYLNKSHFVNLNIFSECIKIIKKEIERSKDDFITDYKRRYVIPQLTPNHDTSYNKMPPSWMLLEVCSFGIFSTMYSNLQANYRKGIAEAFKIHQKVIISWMRSISYVRNICAHHSRLWNRKLAIAPLNAKQYQFPLSYENQKMSCFIHIILYLLNLIHAGDILYVLELKKIILNTDSFIQKGMGYNSPVIII